MPPSPEHPDGPEDQEPHIPARATDGLEVPTEPQDEAAQKHQARIDAILAKNGDLGITRKPPKYEMAAARQRHADNARKRIERLGIEHRLTSRNDEDHQSQLEEDQNRERAKFGPEEDIIFGSRFLHEVDAYRSGSLKPDTYQEVYDEEGNEDIEAGKQVAIASALGAGLERNIERISEHPEFQQQLASELAAQGIELLDTGEDNAPSRLQQAFSGLSTNQREEFLRAHAEKIKEQIAARQPELANAKQDFLDLIELEHSAGKFPLSRQDAVERLERVTIGFSDPWLRDPGTEGTHHYESDTILVSLDSEVNEVVTHEFLHATSGIKAQHESMERPEKKDEILDFFGGRRVIKSGLRITADFNGVRELRFDWLDEALIEQQTMEMTQLQEGTYELPRKILTRLEARVPKKLFVNAQFEDFNPANGTPQSGTPEWGRLNEELSKQFEPRILLILDNIVASDGYEAAIAYLDKNFPPSRKPPKDEAAARRQNRADAARKRMQKLGIKHEIVERTDERHQQQLEEMRREELARIGPEGNTIYGADIIHQIDALRAGQIGPPEGEAVDEAISQTLKMTQLDFLKIGNYSQWWPQIIEELSGQGIELPLAPDAGESEKANAVRGALMGLNDEQRESLLRHHIANTREAIAARQPELGNIQNEFLDRVGRDHAAGKFPLSREQAAARLAKISIKFRDPWLRTPGSVGSFDYEAGALFFSLSADINEGATHEFLHAIGGVKAQHEEIQNPENRTENDEAPIGYTVKGGLRVTEEEHRTPRFAWLDEAVVESQAMEMSGRREGVYDTKRAILDRLETHVPRKIFLDAEFEDYTHEAGTPAWGRLTNELSRHFEPRILLILDELIKSDGEEAAIAYLDEHFPN